MLLLLGSALYGRADEGRGYSRGRKNGCTTRTYLLLCIYSTKRFDIEYEGDLMDFSIESNLASPLEAKSWVLLDTSL